MPLPPLLAERLKRRRILRPEDDVATTITDVSRDQPRPSASEDSTTGISTQASLRAVGESSKVPDSDIDTASDLQDHSNAPCGPENDEEIIAQDYSDSESESQNSDNSDPNHSDNDNDREQSQSSRSSSNESNHSNRHEQREQQNDGPQNQNQPFLSSFPQTSQSSAFGTRSYIKCPNKYNVYHNCTEYCREMYASKPDVPTSVQKSQLLTLLQRFPLLPDWRPVYDPGVATFYFWNIATEQVSWLPLGHPNAVVSFSANRLREMANTSYMT